MYIDLYIFQNQILVAVYANFSQRNKRFGGGLVVHKHAIIGVYNGPGTNAGKVVYKCMKLNGNPAPETPVSMVHGMVKSR